MARPAARLFCWAKGCNRHRNTFKADEVIDRPAIIGPGLT
jgi:hypothetical protein